MHISRITRRALAFALAAAIVPLATVAPAAVAQSFGEEAGGIYSPWRAARITYVSGDVSVLEPYSDGWESAETNTPLFEGYEVYADWRDRAEIALGGLAFLRIGDGADITLAELDPGWTKVSTVSGTVTLSIHQTQRVGRYELSTPTAAVVPERPGTYRVDVADNGDTWLTVSRGSAQVSTIYGAFQALEGDIVSMSYERPEEVELYGEAARWNRDSWDRWSDERDDYYAGLYRRNQPDVVNALLGREDIYGLAELALYGAWMNLGPDMVGWQPESARRSDWSPYQDGYWDYSTVTGWTWVSNEPWGWAPYHHGRWHFDDRIGWVWVPTHGDTLSTRVQPSYRYKWHPALVYMWQPQGYDEYVWVPLAPGERFVPFSQTARASAPPREPAVDRRFVPRHFNERRGIVAIAADALMKRQKPTRASEAVLQKIEPQRQPAATQTPAAATPTVAVLPKPARGPASLAPARAKPAEIVRKRAVVVDPTTEAAAPKAKDPTQAATADPKVRRAERKAQRQQLRLERKKATEATLVQPGAAQEPTTQAPSQQQTPATQPAPGKRGGRKLKSTVMTTQPQPGTMRKPVVTTQPTEKTQPQPGDPQEAKPNTGVQPETGTQTDPNAQTQTDPQQPGQRKGKGQGKKRKAQQQTEGQPPEGEKPPEEKPQR